MKYIIDYGFGTAHFYTAYDRKPDKEIHERFYELAGTCFGIRKSILYVNIMSVTDEKPTVDIPGVVEQLEFAFTLFGGCDQYVWNEEGKRKMTSPYLDEEWEECF